MIERLIRLRYKTSAMNRIRQDLMEIIGFMTEKIRTGIISFLHTVWGNIFLFLYSILLLYTPFIQHLIFPKLQTIDSENLFMINKWLNSAIIQANSSLLGLLIVAIGFSYIRARADFVIKRQKLYFIYLSTITIAFNIILPIVCIIQVDEAAITVFMSWVLSLEVMVIIYIFAIFSIFVAHFSRILEHFEV